MWHRRSCTLTISEPIYSKKWFQHKQSQILISVAFVFIFLTVALLVSVIYVSKTNLSKASRAKHPVAYHTGWIEAAQDLRWSIDFEADACADFFQYACGGWNALHPLRHHNLVNDTENMLEESISRHLIDILDHGDFVEVIEAGEREFFKAKLLPIYQSCVENKQLRSDSVLKVFGTSGSETWALLRTEKNPLPIDYSVEHLITTLTLQHGLNTLLEFRGVQNRTTSMLSIAVNKLPFKTYTAIFYVSSSSDAKRVQEAYKLLIEFFINETAQEDGVHLSDEQIRKAAHDIFAFEQQVAAIKLAEKGSKPVVSTVEQLMIDAAGLNWTNMIPKIFTAAHQLQLENLEELVAVAKLVHKSDRTLVANYIAWRGILSYVPALGPKYQLAMNKFYSSVLDGYMDDRKLICLKYLHDWLTPAIQRLYMKLYTPTGSLHDEIRRIITNMTYVVSEKINGSTAPLIQTASEAYLTQVHFQIGYDFQVTSMTYKTLAIAEGQPFFAVVQKLLLWCLHSQLNQKNYEVGCNSDERLLATNFVKTKLQGPSTIVINSGLFEKPFYGRRRPVAMNYAGLGFAITAQLIAGLSEHVGGLTQKFNNAMDKQYSSFCFDDLQAGLCIDGIRTAKQNLVDNFALQVAFDAYRNAATIERDLALPSLPNFSMDQIFFLSYAGSMCGTYNPSYLHASLLASDRSPNRYRVIGSLQNFHKFAESFQCASGTFMNPNVKQVIN